MAEHGLPRHSFEALPDEIANMLRPKYERLGYLGEFFQIASAQPDALAGFIRFTESLKSVLRDDITEVVAITVAAATQNRYELHQHQRLALKRGFSKEWVRAVEALEPHCQAQLDPTQRAVQLLVIDMVTNHGRGALPHIEVVSGYLPAAEVVAVLLTACRYIGHAAVINALEIQPPVTSPFANPSSITHAEPTT